MPTTAIPLLLKDPGALAGVLAAFPDGAGIGDLPWELHSLSRDAELDLLGEAETPLAVWFETARAPGDDDIRKCAIPLLGTIHLIGAGVAAISEAWIYGAPSKSPSVRPLALQLLGQSHEFFLPAGVDAAALADIHGRITKAVSIAPWVQITIEHFLLALDRTGLSRGILDMTICLESLIRGSAEIGFRLSHQIPPLVTDSPSEQEDYTNLLQSLYAVRSEHVHGALLGKGTKKKQKLVQERWEDLAHIMRTAVRYALEFHATLSDWDAHLTKRMRNSVPRITIEWGEIP